MTILDRRTANRKMRIEKAHQMTIEESKMRRSRKDLLPTPVLATTGTIQVQIQTRVGARACLPVALSSMQLGVPDGVNPEAHFDPCFFCLFFVHNIHTKHCGNAVLLRSGVGRF